MSRAEYDLRNSGFTVLRSVLSTEELSVLKHDYQRVPQALNKNYNVKEVGFFALERLKSRCRNLSRELKDQVGFEADTLVGGWYFASRAVDLGWHQDQEAEFVFQNAARSLAFWIPVEKPDPRFSNVSLIPWDRLKQACPEAYTDRVGKGASVLFPRNNQSLIRDITTGKHKTYPFDLGALVETPELAEGDVLVFRADMIHRTQDSSTARVAASFRMYPGQAEIELGQTVRLSFSKFRVFFNNRRPYQVLLEAFLLKQTHRLRVDEFNPLVLRLAPKWPTGEVPLSQFLKTLYEARRLNSLTNSRN